MLDWEVKAVREIAEEEDREFLRAMFATRCSVCGELVLDLASHCEAAGDGEHLVLAVLSS